MASETVVLRLWSLPKNLLEVLALLGECLLLDTLQVEKEDTFDESVRV